MADEAKIAVKGTDSYTQWLARVPDEVRSSLAEIVLAENLEGYSGTRSLARRIHAEIIRGTIPPWLAPMCLEFLRFELETFVDANVAAASTTTATLLTHFEQVTKTREAIQAVALAPMDYKAQKRLAESVEESVPLKPVSLPRTARIIDTEVEVVPERLRETG